MRISDWSSDVCSSDLILPASEPRQHGWTGGADRVAAILIEPHPRAKTRGHAERSRGGVVTRFSLRSNEPLVFARGCGLYLVREFSLLPSPARANACARYDRTSTTR